MGKFVSKLRALLKAPLFYISVAATAAVAAVACCTVLFWSSPKQSPKNPALTAEQKLFLQQIAETTSQQPTTVEFNCDVSAALAEDEQITEVHHVSESFVVVTIQKTETDGETVISTTNTIEIIENNNGTAAKVAGLNYPVKNSAGLGYSFVSCDGTNIVLSCTQNIQNVGQKTSQVLISSNGTSLIGANAYDEIVCLPSNTLLLLSEEYKHPDDVFDIAYTGQFAKTTGTAIETTGEQIASVLSLNVIENCLIIESLNEFAVYFLNNQAAKELAIANNPNNITIQQYFENNDAELYVMDYYIQQISSSIHYLNLNLTATEANYTHSFVDGDSVYYYTNANYTIDIKNQKVSVMEDQTSTYTFKALANDCYQQTKTLLNGNSTSTYFNAAGEEITMPNFEIIHSFGSTFVATTPSGTALYNQNMDVLLEFQSGARVVFYQNLIAFQKNDYYYLSNSNGQLIIDTPCEHISAEINGKILFGTYKTFIDDEDKYYNVWTFNFIDTETLQITEAENINENFSAVEFLQNFYVVSEQGRNTLIFQDRELEFASINPSVNGVFLKLNNNSIQEITFSSGKLIEIPIPKLEFTTESFNSSEIKSELVNSTNRTSFNVYYKFYGDGSSYFGYNSDIGEYLKWDNSSVWYPEHYIKFITKGYSEPYTLGSLVGYCNLPADYKNDTGAIAFDVEQAGYQISNIKIEVKRGDDTTKMLESGSSFTHLYDTTGLHGFKWRKDGSSAPATDYNVLSVNTSYITSFRERADDGGKNSLLTFDFKRAKNTINSGSTNLYITFNPVSVTVTTIDGASKNSTTQTYGLKYNLTKPTKTGYTFDGWWTTEDNSGYKITTSDGSLNSYVKNSASHNVYAHWTPKEYSISFNKNAPANTTVSWPTGYNPPTKQTYGQLYNLPTQNPVCKTNGVETYTFAGWYTAAEGGTRIKTSDIYNSSNPGAITLYAHWTAVSYPATLIIPDLYPVADRGTDRAGYFGLISRTYSKAISYNIGSSSITLTTPTAVWGFEFDHYKVTSASGAWQVGDRYTTDGTKITINNDGTHNIVSAWAANSNYGNVIMEAIFKVPVYVNSTKIGYHYSDGTTIYSYSGNKASLNLSGMILYDYNKYFSLSGYGDAYNNVIFVPSSDWSNSEGTAPNAKWTTVFYLNGNSSSEYVQLTFNYNSGDSKLYIEASSAAGGKLYHRPLYLNLRYNIITLNTGKNGVEVPVNRADSNQQLLGNGISVLVPTSGELSDLFNTPTYAGYTFDNFYTNSEKTGDPVTSFGSIASGDTLYVKWTPNTYSVAFNGNGATSGVMDSQSFTYGIAQNLSANSFQKTGYTFKGWATSSGGAVVYTNTQSVSNLTTTNQGVVTLYAVWQANTYNATFDANGGSLPSGTTNPKQVTYDRTYGTLPIPLNRTGYTFNGWYTLQSDGDQITTSSIVKITENSTLYAHWTANTYDVTFNANGGKFSDNETTKTIQQTYDESYSLPNVSLNPPTEGGPYYFAGWFTDDGIQITTSSIVKITENTTLYAHWKTHVYYVQFNANYAGSSATYTQQFTYNQEQALATTTLSKTGYHIVGWATTSDGVKVYNPNEEITSNLTDEPNATVNLYAIWAPNTYLVVFNGNGATSGTMQNQSFTYDEAQNLSANSFQETGYHFVGWLQRVGMLTIEYENEEEVSNITSENGATIELFAQWELNTYSVSFNGNDATSGSMDNQLFTYSYFASLTTNSFQKTGHNFEGWATSSDGAVAYADGQVVSNLTTTNGGVVTLYAVWSIATYSINLDSKLYNIDGTQNKAATTAGTTTIYQKYDTGYYSDGDCETEIAETTIPTLTGYTFGGYYTEKNGNGTQCINADGDVISTATQFTSSTLLYASWQPNTYEVIFNGNGAPSGEMENQSFTYDEAQNLSANLFSRTYFNFVGWATTQNAIEAEYEDEESVINLTTTANGSVTLYAVWEAQEFTILFHKNIGEDPEVTYVQKVTLFNKNELYLQTIEQIITENGNFAYGTSSFAGWAISSAAANTIDNSANLAFITDAQQNDVVDLYAVWFFAVTRDANGPTYGADKPTTSEINLLHNGSNKADVVAALSSTSLYTFMGWNTAQDGTGTQITAENVLTLFGSANNSIYAQWQAKTFNIQYVVKERDDTQHGETDQYKTLESYQLKDENGNTITTNSLPQTFTAESLTTLPIVFIDNYDFRGYSYTISGTTHTNIESLPTGDETITEGITVVLSFHRLYSIAVQYISDTTFSEVTKYVQSDGSLANVPYYGFNKEHQTTFECTNINVFSLNGKDYLGVQNTIAGTYYRFLYVTRSDIGGSTYTESQILGSVGFANSNTTIKFHYVERINILFNPNGGTAVSTIEIDKGSSLAAEEIRLGRTFEIAPTKENLTLGGWRFGNNEYVAAADVKNHVFNQRTTLNAEWLAVITYQVVDETGAIVAEETSTQTVVENTSTSTLAIHNKWGTTNHQNNSYYSSDNSFFNGGDLELAIFKINNNLYRFKEVAGAQTLTENTLLNIVLVKRVELSFESQKEINASVQAEIDSTLSAVQLPDFAYISNESTSSTLSFTIFADRNVQINYININGLVIDGTTNYVLSGWDIGEEEAWEQGSMVFSQNTTLTAIWQDAGRFVSIGVFSAETGEIMFENIFYLPTQIIEGVPEYYGNIVITFNDATQTVTISGESVQTQIGSMEFEIPSISLPVEGEFKPVGLLATYDLLSGFNDSLISSQDQAANIIEISASDFASKNFQYVYILYERVDD